MKGAITLDEVITPRLVIRCKRCNREGDYRVSTLQQRYGDQASLPDVLHAIAADCPRLQKMRQRIYDDMCEARFVDVQSSKR